MTNGAEWTGFHPMYRELHGEMLMRSFPNVAGQVMVSHRAIAFEPGEADAHRRAVAALTRRPEIEALPQAQGFQLLRMDDVELRIESHDDFTTFTIFAPQTGLPFVESATDRLPEGLLDGIPGKILAAVEIAGELVAAIDSGTAKTMEHVLEYFDQERLVGGWVMERVASVWSHFRPDERGATRFLVQIHRLTSGRYGRLLQRLVEIENHRMAALLGLSVARDAVSRLGKLEERHTNVLGRLATDRDDAASELLDLAVAAAKIRTTAGPRLRQTTTHAEILNTRVSELREEQVPGYQTLGEFFNRRLIPAWRECATALAEVDRFPARLAGTATLIQAQAPIPLAIEEPAEIISPPLPSAPPAWRPPLEAAAVVAVTLLLAGVLKLLWELSGGRENVPLIWGIALVLSLVGYAAWQWLRAHRDGQIG